MRNVIIAVLSANVFDYFLSSFRTEVNVEVGHRNPFAVQKPFEKQVVLKRLDVGYTHRVSDDTAYAAASPRADRYAVFLCPVDIVPDDKVIFEIPHVGYRAEFVGESFLNFLGDNLIFFVHTFDGYVF